MFFLFILPFTTIIIIIKRTTKKEKIFSQPVKQSLDTLYIYTPQIQFVTIVRAEEEEERKRGS